MKLLYALSGEGRGHASRALALADVLRRRGHEVGFLGGGVSQGILEENGENVLPIPSLTHVVKNNKFQVFPTLFKNIPMILDAKAVIQQGVNHIEAFKPDLIINDFESVSWRSAQKIGVPVISLSNQLILSEGKYPLPLKYYWANWVAGWGIRRISPPNPVHKIITAFSNLPLKNSESATLIPPLIRPNLLDLKTTKEDFILVYHNQPLGEERFLYFLRTFDIPFKVYGFNPKHPEDFPNLQFKQTDTTSFTQDFAACKAVICTAGFSLLSEAVYFGKPVMAIPNFGQFEQWLNAWLIHQNGFGKGVLKYPLQRKDLQDFITSIETYDHKPLKKNGNNQAADLVERFLV